MTVINYATFSNCASATKITLSNNVVSIGGFAFSGCSLVDQFNSDTTGSLIIPTSCKSIDAYAFQELGLMTDLVVPDTVESIGVGAFRGCNSLINVTLPFVGNGQSATGNNAVFGFIFDNDSSSGSHKTSDNYLFGGKVITNQGPNSYGFYIPTTIRNITITKQTAIPNYAFQNCDLIATITIPNSVTSIGKYAFYNCSNLKRLNSNVDGVFNIPASVTEINIYTFYNCTSVEKVTLSNNVTLIDVYAFSGCSFVKQFNSNVDGNLITPTSCVAIGDYAFQGLGLMTDLVVSDATESIGDSAFKDCNSLVNVTLPFVGKSLTATKNDAVFGIIFGYNSNSGSHKTSDNATASGRVITNQGPNSYGFYIPTTIRNVTITVQTAIPNYAFQNCDLIETITIPNSTTSIGNYAFQNCLATVNQTYVPKVSSIWDGSVAAGFHGGDGTEENPYVIFDGAELAYFAEQVNGGNTFEGEYIVLSSDLLLNNRNFVAIGLSDHPFLGHFSGNGHLIKNANLTSTNAQYVGIFGYCDGTIERVGFKNIAINSTVNDSGEHYAAPIAYLGENGVVSDCYSDGTITMSGSCNYQFAGGLVGYAKGTIMNSYSLCKVSVTSNSLFAYAGGLVGCLENGTIDSCFATGNVTAKGANTVYSRNGGIVGHNIDGNVTNCYRSSSQVLTRNGESGANNTEGSSISLDSSNVKQYIEAFGWDLEIWNFDNGWPRLIVK